MAADFKSHVLRRDEKGFVGIPFKRLLLAGVIGGLSYSIVNIFISLWSILVPSPNLPRLLLPSF